jgi:hypothetical protein
MSNGTVAIPLKPFYRDTSEAIAFWLALENRFYINGDPTMTESRKVASTLMHFQLDSLAGDWAHEKMGEALAKIPIDFGTWNGFKDAFKAMFFPVKPHMEAANAMLTTRMGNRLFPEWYQEWFAHTCQSEADDKTKIFAFTSMIPADL